MMTWPLAKTSFWFSNDCRIAIHVNAVLAQLDVADQFLDGPVMPSSMVFKDVGVIYLDFLLGGRGVLRRSLCMEQYREKQQDKKYRIRLCIATRYEIKTSIKVRLFGTLCRAIDAIIILLAFANERFRGFPAPTRLRRLPPGCQWQRPFRPVWRPHKM